MTELPVPRAKVVSRLQRVEGQLRGIQKMVNDERPCVEVLVQLAAARSAIESVAVLVLKNYTHLCMAKTPAEGNAVAELAEAVALWTGAKSK